MKGESRMNAQERKLIAKYERVLQELTELNERSENVIDQLELEVEGYKELCTCLTEKMRSLLIRIMLKPAVSSADRGYLQN